MPLAVKRLLATARGMGHLPAPHLLQGWMIEPVARPTRHLWIWGAGHVGRALVRVLATLPIRVHWFDKVEMFIFCDPKDAESQHRAILQFEQDYLNSLEVPYRVIDVAAGDLGSSAIRKFDCEAWIPSQERYRELTSTSNCTTFQSRRLRVRMKDSNGTRPLATLNGTLVAITRTIIAILENHQQADGSVYVPVALRPYLGGKEYLVP